MRLPNLTARAFPFRATWFDGCLKFLAPVSAIFARKNSLSRTPSRNFGRFQYENSTLSKKLSTAPSRKSRRYSAKAVHKKYTSAVPPRKSQLFNTKVECKVNIRSLSSKVATFRFQSSTRNALPQLQLTRRAAAHRGIR